MLKVAEPVKEESKSPAKVKYSDLAASMGPDMRLDPEDEDSDSEEEVKKQGIEIIQPLIRENEPSVAK